MGCGSSSATKITVPDPAPVVNKTQQLEVPTFSANYPNGDQFRRESTEISGSQRPSIATNDFEINEEGSVKLQYICDTGISLEWLYQRLIEKFKCRDEPEPQWIAERLNVIGDKDLDQTTVLRVTFGWENEKLPKSVVLKICVSHINNGTNNSNLASRMFKRECNVYEWLTKQKRLLVPRVFVIKKQATEAGNGVIIMEDLNERAQVGNLSKGMCVDGVRDLLRNLAQIHAYSLKYSDWTTMVTENSPFLYQQTADFASSAVKSWPKFEEIKFQMLSKFLSEKYLSAVATDSLSEDKIPRVLVHGNPAAHSIFLSKEEKIAAIIDWTQAHPGCYAEDVTKAICWNLNAKDRHDNVLRLLEHYHFHLIKFYGSSLEEFTLEQVKKQYQKFFPFVTITFLLFMPGDYENADQNLLDRAQCLIDDTLTLTSGMDSVNDISSSNTI